jgi:hypothetical protein
MGDDFIFIYWDEPFIKDEDEPKKPKRGDDSEDSASD